MNILNELENEIGIDKTRFYEGLKNTISDIWYTIKSCKCMKKK